MPRLDSPDQANILLSADPPDIDCDLLVKAACRSFELLEPWDQATSNNPAVNTIICQVQAQGDNFYNAVGMSQEAAQQAHIFCEDYATILGHIHDQNVHTEELREIISGMLTIAGRVRRIAERQADHFRTMHQGILEVTNSIPVEVSLLEAQIHRARKQAEAGQKRVNQVKVAKACSIAGAAVFGGIAIFAFPPAVVVLPVVFPIITLVAECIEMKISKRVASREKQSKDCKKAIEQLERVTSDMVQLLSSVNSFAQYWVRQETILEIVKSRLENLRESKYTGLKLDMIQRNWVEVAKSLRDYSVKMKTLLSYIPHNRASLKDHIDPDPPASISHSHASLRRQNAVKISRDNSHADSVTLKSRNLNLLIPPSPSDPSSQKPPESCLAPLRDTQRSPCSCKSNSALESMHRSSRPSSSSPKLALAPPIDPDVIGAGLDHAIIRRTARLEMSHPFHIVHGQGTGPLNGGAIGLGPGLVIVPIDLDVTTTGRGLRGWWHIDADLGRLKTQRDIISWCSGSSKES
ncbi:hypothetical protein Hypma_006855 [Hypsizygus marmoreus]|uniref:Uncharacterized protein n=1 Tax=Hypsizygus marmoreus TaxID=39966 RepID=A0A369JX86_HYPMA|nr:hypothetical protein Hypma_006855 [Hypsizygus marmoreus]